MKRRIRNRCILKWMAGFMCIGTIAFWALCHRYEITYTQHWGTMECSPWAISFIWNDLTGMDDSFGWNVERKWTRSGWFSPLPGGFRLPRFVWYKFSMPSDSFIYASVHIPYWCIVLVAAILTCLLVRLDRRFKQCCRQCDYNLTGNVSGVCPECGTAIGVE